MIHAELAELTHKYISRFQECHELLDEDAALAEQLKRKVRNSQHAKRDMFTAAEEIEGSQFYGQGIDVPDFLSKAGLQALMNWDETIQNLPQIKPVKARSTWLKSKNEESVPDAEMAS